MARDFGPDVAAARQTLNADAERIGHNLPAERPETVDVSLAMLTGMTKLFTDLAERNADAAAFNRAVNQSLGRPEGETVFTDETIDEILTGSLEEGADFAALSTNTALAARFSAVKDHAAQVIAETIFRDFGIPVARLDS